MNKTKGIIIGGVAIGGLAGLIYLLTRRPAGGGGAPAHVRGTVTNAYYSTAIAGAVVSIAGHVAISDSSGHYDIAEDIPSGIVSVLANAEGYIQYSTQMTLVPGDNNITIYLSTTDDYSGVISGSAKNSSGQPVAGVTVTLSQGSMSLHQTTNEDGWYQFTNLLVPNSGIQWGVDHDGYEPQSGLIDIISGINTLNIVLAPISGTIGFGTFTAEKVTCYYADGSPPFPGFVTKGLNMSCPITRVGNATTRTLKLMWMYSDDTTVHNWYNYQFSIGADTTKAWTIQANPFEAQYTFWWIAGSGAPGFILWLRDADTGVESNKVTINA